MAIGRVEQSYQDRIVPRETAAAIPNVRYVSSTKQAIVDDWRAFIDTQLMPIDVHCDHCNGILELTSHKQVYARANRHRVISGVKMPEDDLNKVVLSIVRTFMHQGKIADPNSYLPSAEVLTEMSIDRFNYIVANEYEAVTIESDLVSWCKHCNRWVVVDVPSNIRSDIRETLIDLVYQEKPNRFPLDESIASYEGVVRKQSTSKTPDFLKWMAVILFSVAVIVMYMTMLF